MVDKKTVTILVCTPDLNSDLTRKCIESVKRYTSNISYELLIFDNGRFGSFQHPLEINRALEIARGDVVVTLDDDVEVTEGWLDALLELAEPDVGIVGCVNLHSRPEYLRVEDNKFPVRHSGGYVDINGKIVSYRKELDKPIVVPFVGSACFLINDKSFRFDLDYKKYYQEVDLCLKSWMEGKKVIVSPHKIYHYGWAQMEALGYGNPKVEQMDEEDFFTFRNKWIESRELDRLYPKIMKYFDIPLPEKFWERYKIDREKSKVSTEKVSGEQKTEKVEQGLFRRTLATFSKRHKKPGD